MKKTTVFQDVATGFKRLFWDDPIKIFTKEFFTELYILHFSATLNLFIIPICIILMYSDLKDTPILFQCFIAGLLGWAFNWLRELYKERKAKNEGWVYPFDYTDVNFGGYGGFVAPLVVWLILTIFKLK